MNIYVGNISWNVTEDELRDLFAGHGEVVKANIIKDKFTGKSRGFGFVEMSNDEEAQAAIEELNGKDLGGRTLTVSQAKERTERPRNGGFGGNRGGSRGGFGGNHSGDRNNSRGGFGSGFGGGRGRY